MPASPSTTAHNAQMIVMCWSLHRSGPQAVATRAWLMGAAASGAEALTGPAIPQELKKSSGCHGTSLDLHLPPKEWISKVRAFQHCRISKLCAAILPTCHCMAQVTILTPPPQIACCTSHVGKNRSCRSMSFGSPWACALLVSQSKLAMPQLSNMFVLP